MIVKHIFERDYQNDYIKKLQVIIKVKKESVQYVHSLYKSFVHLGSFTASYEYDMKDTITMTFMVDTNIGLLITRIAYL